MELWLPWIEVVIACGFALAAGVGPFSRPMKVLWIRYMLQVLGILVAFPVAFLTLWEASSVWSGGHTGLLGSPDEHYVARVVSRAGGATDLDQADVIVRRRWSPTWTNAYVGAGQVTEQVSDPAIKWTNNRTLLIEYTGVEGYPLKCTSTVDEVTVLCRRKNSRGH